MVASDIPCLRARSAVFVPASCSFNTAIICSSVNLARFICPSLFRPDSDSIWRKYSVAFNAMAGKQAGEGRTGELRALIGGPAWHDGPIKSIFKCLDAERRLDRDRQRQDKTPVASS